MAYKHFDKSLPDATHDGPTVILEIKEQLLAMRDAIIASGGFFGWPCTPSGPAAAPTSWMHANGTERIRITPTRDGNGFTVGELYEYSADSGATWDTITAHTLNYDAAYMFTGDTWS